MQKIDALIEENNVSLEDVTAREHAKAKQKESRAASQQRGHAGRLAQKGKARTAEKPWGGKRAR